jgi:hypothetical protein
MTEKDIRGRARLVAESLRKRATQEMSEEAVMAVFDLLVNFLVNVNDISLSIGRIADSTEEKNK